MNREALFCDGTQDYVIPAEPKENEKIKIRFRTAHNDVEEVHILTGNSSYPMWKIVSEGEFDFYEIEWQLSDVPFSYLFEVKSGDQICYFSRCGVSDQREDFYAFMIVPGFSTPEWAKGAVMYQIFVDRFCNGDPTNDVEDGEYIYIGAPSVKIKDWSKVPAAMDIRNFYVGDLQGVMDKLDYLQDLGVEVVYFNTLFVSPSNHKYDIQDYDYIDPHMERSSRTAERRFLKERKIIQALQNIRSEQAISAILKRATSCLQGLWRRCTKEGCV